MQCQTRLACEPSPIPTENRAAHQPRPAQLLSAQDAIFGTASGGGTRAMFTPLLDVRNRPSPALASRQLRRLATSARQYDWRTQAHLDGGPPASPPRPPPYAHSRPDGRAGWSLGGGPARPSRTEESVLWGKVRLVSCTMGFPPPVFMAAVLCRPMVMPLSTPLMRGPVGNGALLGMVPLHSMRRPSQLPPRPSAVILSVGEEAVDEAPEPPPQGQRSWFQRLRDTYKFDRSSITKLGSSMVFSYGLVSNINTALLIVLSWVTFRRTNPLLPPLVPSGLSLGPINLPSISPKLLVVYGGYYATVGNILRPVRLALATLLAPVFGRGMKWVKDQIKVSPWLASTLTVMLFVMVNASVTVVLSVTGVRIACAIAGVSVFPPQLP